MAVLETEKKVSYLGKWLEDTVTETVMKNIAAHAHAQKGKKMKLKLSNIGIKLNKAKWFQDSSSEFIPIQHVVSMSMNPVYPMCVLCTLADKKRRYNILAFKLSNEVDSAHLVQTFSNIKQSTRSANVEFKKREDGNWTLRARSELNANRHMNDIFKENHNTPVNGNANHVPVLDRSKASPPATSIYVKRSAGAPSKSTSTAQTNINNNSDVPADDEEVAKFKDELDSLTKDIQEIKIMLQANGNEEPEYVEDTNNNPGILKATVPNGHIYQSNRVGEARTVVKDYRNTSKDVPADTNAVSSYYVSALPSKPEIVRAGDAHAPSAGYKPPPQVYMARPLPSQGYPVQRHASRDYVLPPGMDRKLSAGMESGRSSLRVKFNHDAIQAHQDRRLSKSGRVKSHFGVPTTVERSIEETYQRPVVIRRQQMYTTGSGGRPRPASFHAVSNHELRLYEARESHGDLLL